MIPNVRVRRASGLNLTAPVKTSVSALICGGVAISASTGITGIDLNQVVKLRSVSDALSYGINAAYDATNKILVYHHIARFFKRCPTGVLYLMLTPQRIAPVSAVGATTVFTVGTGAATSDTWIAHVGALALLAAPLSLSTGSPSATASAIVTAINAYTGTSGASATTGSGGVFTVTLPSSLGATINGTVPTITETGTVASTAAAASGGVTAVTGGAIKLSDMLDPAQAYATTLLRSTISGISKKAGDIFQLGAVLNPDATALAAETDTDGISSDTVLAINKAQGLADAEFAAFRPVDIIIEGRKFSGLATDAEDIRALASGQVGVVLGADNDISVTDISMSQPYLNYAAVGDALGCIAQASVSQSIGATSIFNLTDSTDGSFINPGLSSGLPLVSATGVLNYSDTDLNTLYDSGYILPRYVVGLAGCYWAGYPTCTLITNDDSFGEYSRTLNAAARLVRQSWLKYINGNVKLNADGTIVATQVASMEANAESYLDQLLTSDDTSGPSTVKVIQIDQDGNPINFTRNGSVVNYVATVLIKGVIRNIIGTVALTDATT